MLTMRGYILVSTTGNTRRSSYEGIVHLGNVYPTFEMAQQMRSMLNAAIRHDFTIHMIEYNTEEYKPEGDGK